MSAPAFSSSPPTVLVTGAAKRLGREVALALAGQGWRVAVHYRDSVEEARHTVADCARLTQGAQAFRSNLGNETALRNLFPAVVSAFGQVDALVHCAATMDTDSVATFSFASMEKHLRSNTGAALVLGQALHGHIAQRRGKEPKAAGVVVNLLAAQPRTLQADLLSYHLSKAALEVGTRLMEEALQPLVKVVGVSTAAEAAKALQTHGHVHAH